jgi:steroid 5-alpha reductase family enzyme
MQAAMDDAPCDILGLAWDGLNNDNLQIQCSVMTCLAVIVTVFIASEATGNYSQVDKLWSLIPAIYAWVVVCDARTLLMAYVSTVWAFRLTFNFNRRGGYRWPPWQGDEDYRWKLLQDGIIHPIFQNRMVFFLFNIFFISIYQNLLLWVMVAPSVVAHIVATSPNCVDAPLNFYDFAATILVLLCVVTEGIADNQQYAFQTKKYNLRNAGKPLEGDYADGFNQSGLFSIVRKPNYAAEQATWISYYLFSVAAFQGQRWLNPSIIGAVLIVLLFAATGPATENITVKKYPKYKEYKKAVPLYIPNPFKSARGAKRSM